MPIRCVLDQARVVACGLPPMGSASRFKHVARGGDLTATRSTQGASGSSMPPDLAVSRNRRARIQSFNLALTVACR